MRSTKFVLSLTTFLSILSFSSFSLGAPVATSSDVVLTNMTASGNSRIDRIRSSLASLSTEDEDEADRDTSIYGKTFLVLNNPSIPNANCIRYMETTNSTVRREPNHPESHCKLELLSNSIPEAYARLDELEKVRDARFQDGRVEAVFYCKTTNRSPYCYDTRIASAILEQRRNDVCYSWEKRRQCSISQQYGSSDIGYCRPDDVDEGNGFHCGLSGGWSYTLTNRCMGKTYPPRAGGIISIVYPWPFGAIRVSHSGRRSEVD